MQRTNSKVRKYLAENGYKDIYFYPHSRFSKDYIIDDIAFDGVCHNDKKMCFFQAKTNKKPSKKLMERYRELSKKYGIICLFLVNFDRKGIVEYN